MRIEHTVFPTSEDMGFLTQKINEASPDFEGAYPFAFSIRDENKQIIAGCNGSVIFGVIYTDQLWVHPDHRKAGLGRQLMEEVHDYGRQVGCTMATVATMTFQNACPFYERLGYQVDFERKGYAKGSSCLFMRRDL